MAGKKILELDAAALPLSDIDVVHAVQGLADKKLSVSQLRSDVSSVDNVYTASGLDNTITLNPSGNTKTPSEYFDGLTVNFLPLYQNTGATNVALTPLGVRNVYYKGIPLASGVLTASVNATIRYAAATARFNLLLSDTLIPNLTAPVTGTSDELNVLDGATAGTAVENKAVVLDGSSSVSGLGAIAATAFTQAGNSVHDVTSFQGTNQELAATGYQKIPGGLILQWGTGTRTLGSTTSAGGVTYPLAFPTACIFSEAVGSGRGSLVSASKTTTTCSYAWEGYGFSIIGPSFTWFAVGY